MLLCLFAHPDDESFMAAGTLARLADRGVRTAVVCATRGQAGSAGTPPLASREELPALREAELRAACAILGVAAVTVLDERDRALGEADPDAMRRALVAAIRGERPSVVLTFDPNGVNGHPDHVAIARFALDAVPAAADARWYPELGAAHRVRRVVWPSPAVHWEEWRPDVLARTPGVDILCAVGAWRERKRAALEAHRTQHGSIARHWWAAPPEALDVETFRVGWGAAAPAGAADLLDGLE
jgi:LmbE family N-acetylglucosaminyl deacetylase